MLDRSRTESRGPSGAPGGAACAEVTISTTPRGAGHSARRPGSLRGPGEGPGGLAARVGDDAGDLPVEVVERVLGRGVVAELVDRLGRRDADEGGELDRAELLRLLGDAVVARPGGGGGGGGGVDLGARRGGALDR